MDESLRKNVNFVRSSLLYEFFRGNPIFETYKNFCKVMGGDVMEYREFEFWYMRFEKANYDLTWDSSSLISSTLSLPDMPIEIFQKIVKDATWKEVMALRQVSRNIRKLVDGIKFNYTEASIVITAHSTILSIDGETRICGNITTNFSDCDMNALAYILDENQTEEDRQFGEHFYRPFHELNIMMKHPNVKLERLFINYQVKRWKFVPLSKRANIRVKTVIIDSKWVEAQYYLELLEPGTLEEIVLKNDYGHFGMSIYGYSQWRQARTLRVTGFFYYLHVDNLSHFVQFDLEIYNMQLEDLLRLKKVILNSSSFEKCHLKWQSQNWRQDLNELDMDDVEMVLGPHIRTDPNNPNCHYYIIEQDEEMFEWKISPTSVDIERFYLC